MEHVVFYPAQDGSPAFRRVAGLEEAVRLVEHLRNVEQVEDVTVHALTEVPLAFRPWYRVELPEAVVPAQAAPTGPPVPAAAEEVAPPREAEPVPAARGGRETKGLGFFAT